MSDLEQTAIERLKAASDMSLRLFEKPLVITYSGGKDSDVMLHLAEKSGIPFEVLHSLTTADAPETVRHVYDTFRRLEEKGVKCTVDKHVQPDGSRVTMWNLIPRKLMPPTRVVRYCCAELKEGGGKGRYTGSILVRDPLLPKIQEGHTMMRLVIDIYDGEDTQGTKEAVAMLLEPLGRVRVVSIITDGKEEKR